MSKSRITITEDMIRDAAKAYGEAVLASRAEDIKNRKAKRSASRIINHRRVVFRVAVCILAVFILIGGVFVVDASARERFVNWVRSIFETRVEYRFEGKPPVQYAPLFPADFSLSSPDNAVCTVDTDTRKEYGIDAGSDSYHLIYMLSTEYDFSSEIGPEYTGSEVWINGLEGKYYEALQDDVPDLMIWHDAYDIVYILESSAGQEAMQAFAENIRLEYHLDHAVCYNGAISHADFSLLEEKYEIECMDDQIHGKTYMFYGKQDNSIGIFEYDSAAENIEFLLYFGDLEYESESLVINQYKADYYEIKEEEFNWLLWMDESLGVTYAIQMNGMAEDMRGVAELIWFTP